MYARKCDVCNDDEGWPSTRRAVTLTAALHNTHNTLHTTLPSHYIHTQLIPHTPHTLHTTHTTHHSTHHSTQTSHTPARYSASLHAPGRYPFSDLWAKIILVICVTTAQHRWDSVASRLSIGGIQSLYSSASASAGYSRITPRQSCSGVLWSAQEEDTSSRALALAATSSQHL